MAYYTPTPNEIASLVQDPGVYLFFDKNDQIIYIGKALNLRSRVKSYWNDSSKSDRPKLKFLVPKIHKIETIITSSEKEALILEASLIFKHQPRYNVLLKDNNKNYPWLVITYDETYPRLIPIRNAENYKTSKTKNKFFGPYTNIAAMYENLNLVHELFPLRRKKIPPFKDRPCLNYDLGLCLGPCQKLISEEEYHLMLEQVELLLKGNHQDLSSLLEKEMQNLSDNLEFERAAKIRDRILALKTFNEKQNVISENTKLDQDIFVLVKLDDDFCVQVFQTRSGRLIQRESLELSVEAASPQEIFSSAFEQYYSQISNDQLPKEILVNYDFDFTLYEDWLSERRSNKINIIKPKRGDKLAQIKLAERNGKIILEKLKLEQMEEASKDINQALKQLSIMLGLHGEPQRIECYDISHLQGHHTVASMVVFTDGLPNKDEYRRFKISQDQNNDFASMQEVMKRRFKDPENNILPNLIIIDGGKGQLNAAAEILSLKELQHIKIVSLAKKEEEIFELNNDKPIILDRKSPELFLVQRIRNEAHRFAITYHRKLRSKASLISKLDGIPGLGPQKKKNLLKLFPNLKKIQDHNIEELQSITGFQPKILEELLKALEPK